MAEQVPETIHISFISEINPTTCDGLLSLCSNLSNKGVKVIYLMLSSSGGDVDGGIALYNLLRALPIRLITHNVGAVNSIGNVVFLAGDERYANPGATFMFHGAGRDVQNARLEEKMLLETLDGIQAAQKKIASIIRQRASFSNDDEIEKLFLQAATKDTDFAQERGIIKEVREAAVPAGGTVLHPVFQR